ncbi:MAG: OmpA family protein [Oligoflexus sp.]
MMRFFTRRSRSPHVRIACLSLAIGLAAQAGAYESKRLSTPKSLEIQDIQITQNARHVYLPQIGDEPVLPGTYFTVKRSGKRLGPQFQNQMIAVGLVKAKSISDHYVLAEVIEEGTAQSQYFFPDYPGIMVGDVVEAKKLVIQQNLQIAPSKSVSYFDLFVDPRRDPTSFELSEKGKQILRDLAKIYGGMRVPIMLIEGHTDQNGAANANQIESYQRAMTVSQFLSEELGFDRERLVPLGLGESEPLAEPYLPDHEQKARRIVFKVKAVETH